jgi:acetyl-CoA synthetase (ADP-forming)
MTCKEIIEKNVSEGRGFIPESEAYKVCNEFHIPSPPTEVVRTMEEGFTAAEAMGYPVVLKIVSPAIIHKSEVDGVIVGIESKEALGAAYGRLMNSVKEKAGDVPIDGVLIQKAMPKGVEVAAGGLRDEQFGPVVMFGSGGVLIEVFKDVAFRLAPLDKAEARRQIEDTKAYEILKGVRGASACDIDALTELMVNTGRLLSELPEIDQIDFNPVLAYPTGCTIVDARIILSRKG